MSNSSYTDFFPGVLRSWNIKLSYFHTPKNTWNIKNNNIFEDLISDHTSCGQLLHLYSL